jgi:signal transduction histidine kinase
MNKTAQFDMPWQTLIETAPCGLCVLDAAGSVRYANPAALNLLGLQPPEGAPATEWLAGLGDLNRDSLLKAIGDGGHARLHLPEGQYEHLVFEAEMLTGTGGTLGYIRRDHEVEASEAVAILIHDLRLPMTSIMGYSKMLLTIGAESLSDMQRQFLDTIVRNVQRLENNLLAAQDMTRIDRARIKLAFTPLSSSEVAAQVLGELAHLVEEKGHNVSLDFPDDLPPVRADAERFKQILRILLENALKYTRPGGQIGLNGHATADLVQIDVTDNGIGILPAERDKVFTKFFRGEDERIREYYGLGLNLYIARGLTQLQGGQLWFESAPGQGTTFSLTLPKSEAA